MLSADKVTEARRAIHQHLLQANVYSTIRDILAAHAAENSNFDPSNAEQVIKILRERGIVNQILGNIAPAVSEVTSKVNLSASDRAIHVRLLGGRAFLDLIDGSSISNSYMVTHLQFGEQRVRSSRLRASVDPSFDDDFVLRLPCSIRDPVEDTTELHVIVCLEDADGCRVRMLGENVIEWRRAFRNAISLAVELAGGNPGVPSGILDIKLEIIPAGQRKTEEEIAFFVEQTTQNVIASDREFLVFARRWWAELHSNATETHPGVKIFAPSAAGRMLPVTHFIDPIPPEREFEDPLHAARFVSLFGLDAPTEDCELGLLSGIRTGPGEQWLRPFNFLVQRRGDSPNHALLLCSIFIGMGLDAYCAIMQQEDKIPCVVVLTQHVSKGYILWVPTQGKHVRWTEAGEVGFKTLACVFSNDHYYANLQSCSLVNMSFDFTDDTKWKEINPLKLRLVPRICAPPLLWVPLNLRQTEHDLETKLRASFTDHRDRLSLPTRWDDDLSSVLSMGLSKYEEGCRTGSAADLSFFHDAVRGKIGQGRSFKGFPVNVTHMNDRRILTAALENAVGKSIIEHAAEDSFFAIRSKIFLFPERIVSVWVMFSVRFRARI